MFRFLCIVYLIVLGGCGIAVDGVKPVFRMAGMAELNMEADAKQQGMEHFAARHFGLAVKYFRLAVALNPVSIEALNGLAASYDQLARYDVAERYYRKALDLDPHSSQTLNNVGFSYYLQGKFDLAHAYLSDAFAVVTDDPIVLANRRLVAGAQASSTPAVQPTGGDVKRLPVPTREPDRTAVAQPALRIERTSREVQTLVTKSRPDPVSMTVTAMAVDGGGASVSKFSTWPVTVEVSNGTGRSRMASRMRQYLATKGVRPAYLSNADTYSKKNTTIYYGQGWSDHAGALAKLLPKGVRLRKEAEQGAAIRVELGADLLDFDLELLDLRRTVSDDESTW